MAESVVHRHLVEILHRWVARQCVHGKGTAVLVDDGDGRTGPRPPMVNGHVPDVYVPLLGSMGAILGESKTASDLESDRSLRQLKDFLRHCNFSKSSCLVLAVPWTHVVAARNLLATLKQRTETLDVKSCVISELDAGVVWAS